MFDARSCVFVIAVAVTIACGPPKLGGGETSETDSSTSDDTEPSTSESGDPSTTTDTSSEAPNFAPEEDVPFECDPYAQDCPEGEKCVPYASSGGVWDDHKCVPVTGNQAPGEPCMYGGIVEATDDCDETSACWDVMDVDGQPIGVCTPFCLGSESDPECPPMSQCTLSGSGTINFCIKSCDPTLQDCGAGLGCFWANNDFNCIFTARDIPAGEPCGFINDCAAGLGCLPAEVLPDCAGSACCSAFCDLNRGDEPCDAIPGTVCSAFFEEGTAPLGYDHVGEGRS
ncbi:MAG TPA: hypothetical protein VM869_23190, partial [Enhygromyxa sp.]|nr:hypothetical protein [Enhygromyxa sp.]